VAEAGRHHAGSAVSTEATGHHPQVVRRRSLFSSPAQAGTQSRLIPHAGLPIYPPYRSSPREASALVPHARRPSVSHIPSSLLYYSPTKRVIAPRTCQFIMLTRKGYMELYSLVSASDTRSRECSLLCRGCGLVRLGLFRYVLCYAYLAHKPAIQSLRLTLLLPVSLQTVIVREW
jgi:hypothetical protein